MSRNVPRPQPTRRLPAQPNLEQLRKQAKDLLELYRSGEAAAIAEVRRFERHPDPSALALHDAQRVLARAYGYDSWPKLAAFVNGANVGELGDAVQAGDMPRVQALVNARPELVGMDLAENNEHRALHFAVLRRDVPMVRLLMQAGADARKGIFPHRDATSAYALARDRDYHDVVAAIEAEEDLRRRQLSCPNATISAVQDRITTAIREGDREQAIHLLEEDPSLIHACDRNGGTALHIAAEESDRDMVEWLLQHRASPRKKDMRERTPLDRAALEAEPEFPAIAHLLLEHGAEVTIHAAVALGDTTRVRELLAADPGPLRQVSSGGGLLTLAVKHGQLEMVRLLLDLGADVDERIFLEEVENPTLSWGMPLWHAARANRREIAELLLDRGADPNANVYASGWPLGNAWNHPDGKLKKLLLARGAKRQPYMLSEQHDVDEARRLLEADRRQEIVRELAWSACDQGCPEILRLALPHIPLAAGDSGWWHWILIQPIRGATADHTSREGHFECMAALLAHGIDPNISRYGQTALHFAAAYHGTVSDEDRARFAVMLLDAGARLDARDHLLKSTPLGWACRWGRIKMVELLLSRGASVDELDADPWATPRAWAAKMGRAEVLALLGV